MQVQGNDSDLRAQPGGAQVGAAQAGEDVRLQQVHQRLDQMSRSLQELRVRRPPPGAEAASREVTRSAIEEANTKLVEIQAELDGLRSAMKSRAVIEQAKGMLMVRLQVDEDTAFEYLRRLSNTTNRKVSDVAADVVRTRAGEPGVR